MSDITKETMESVRLYSEKAYNPYSKYYVGAAVTARRNDDTEQMFYGVNIENASYGLTCCAERVAIFKAVSEGFTKITEVFIHCRRVSDDPVLPYSATYHQQMPCGACLQVIAEFAEPTCPVHIDRVGTFNLSNLLPHPFNL